MITNKRKTAFCLLAVLLLLPYTIYAQSAVFYVSPSGSDSNPGTLAQPFKTIEKARDTVRTINSNMNSDITVFIRGGVYNPIAPIVFGSQDSGTNGYNIIYKGYPGERAEISGGQRITVWTSVGNGIYKASLASFPSSALPFRQLFVNGQRAIRARTPNVGSYFNLLAWDKANKRVRVSTAGAPNYNDITNIEMIIHRIWITEILKVASFTPIDANSAYVYFQNPGRDITFDWPDWHFRDTTSSYHYENNYAFLTAEGEWFCNSNTKEVFYKPRAGEDINTAEVIAPVLETLISVTGSNHIQFKNLVLEHTTWMFPNTYGFNDHQANDFKDSLYSLAVVPGAIEVQDSSNIVFERNLITHTGNAGLVFSHDTHDNSIIGNVVSDIGGNGISVNHNRVFGSSNTYNETIKNNYVTKVGQDITDSVGIFAGYVQNLKIEHNEIFDSPYSGISEGWGWGTINNFIRDVSIRYNRIYNVMNLMCDGGAIYTLGDQSTTHQYATGAWIEQNYIYNINRSPWATDAAPVAGVYPDEGSDWITIQNNVFENVPLIKNVNAFGTNLQWIPWPNSNIIDNDIKAAAGIEAAYADIRDGDPLGDVITQPTISGVGSGSITSNSAVITWTTDEGSDSQVEYGLTTAYGNSTTLNANMVTSHSQGLSGLTANTIYHFRVKSKDAAGNLATSGDNTVMTLAVSTQAPYSGTPISLPGTVQAEDYDNGGEGVAYHDTTSGNSGGQYRSDGVDIWGPLDSSYVIGDTWTGEWLEYTVNVASSGTYTIEARVSSIDSYGKFHIEIDGADVTGQLTMPAYGGSLVWSTMSKTGVSLTAGQHTMRISLDSNGNGNLEAANLNWVRFNQNASCVHKSDTNCDSCVSMPELQAFISRWQINNQDVILKEIIEAMGLWKRGC